MDKKTVRTGIVGTGFSASFHFEALRKIYGTHVDVVGAHSIDTESGTRYAAERGIEFFPSLDALIERADVIHVCVPPQVHETVSVAALNAGKNVICEKPLTGYFGDGSDDFHWDRADKRVALSDALASVDRLIAAERNSPGRLLYAENWVYAPSIQKEREVLEKTGGQILWIHGEEAHSGSHSVDYAYAARCGGGVLIGKGCHPLTAALYLKRVEGFARDGKPIVPKTVTARGHALTRLPAFRDEGHIRCDYHDIEDFSMMHVEFTDGTIATVFASDIILGGIHNWLEVSCNNHRAICNINPNTAMQTYNPRGSNFDDIYVLEKIETKEGWACTSPDEDWMTGYPQEMEAFYRTIAYDEPPQSTIELAADTISTIYSAYVSSNEGGRAIEVKTY